MCNTENLDYSQREVDLLLLAHEQRYVPSREDCRRGPRSRGNAPVEIHASPEYSSSVPSPEDAKRLEIQAPMRKAVSFKKLVCMYYVCMYVFIKLHITTQSGPVILVILCHSH